MTLEHLPFLIHILLLSHIIFYLQNIRKNLHRIWSDERIISIISYVEKNVQFDNFLFGKRSSSSSVLLKEIDFVSFMNLFFRGLHSSYISDPFMIHVLVG